MSSNIQEVKIAYIMRGLPGSGKSTVAKQLAGKTGVIHSNDTYLIVDGKYQYSAEQLPTNRQKNFSAFKKSLEEGIGVVVCDNTNTKRWEFQNYIEAANQAGYIVAIVQMPHPNLEQAFKRNIHQVPMEILGQMLSGWEN